MNKKRDTIMQAARKVFLDQGYSGASMDAISQQAGVSKATVYAHFPGKEQLFTEMVGDYCREQQQAIEEIEAEHYALEEGLYRIALRIMQFLTHPNAMAFGKMIIGESSRFPQLGRVFVESGFLGLQEAVAGYLRRAAAREQLAIEDPELTAELFLGMIRNTILQRSLYALGKAPTQKQLEKIAAGAARLVSASVATSALATCP